MRTEDFKHGVVPILLVLGLVLSIILIAPLASSGNWVNRPEPGGTTIEVVQGDNFLIRHVLEWDEAQDGAYTVTIWWINYDNEPSENLTFLSAEAYFTTGPNAGEQTQADVMLASAPSGSDTSWALSVQRPADNKDSRNGQFNVDIWMGAFGVGGVPHIQTDNHPILEQFSGVIVIESGLVFGNRAPITIRVLPPTGLLPHDPIYIEGNAGFTPENGVNGGGSGTENDPYIIENWYISVGSDDGIHIRNTTAYFIIRNCYVHDGAKNGIHFSYNVTNGVLDNNLVESNDFGLTVWMSDHNTLTNNTLQNNNEGIRSIYSDNTTLINNTCENNNFGIVISRSDNNTLDNNTLSNNRYNFSVYGYSISHFVHDIDTSNLVNGKPIRYLVDNKNEIIGPSLGAGYLALVNCENILVENLALENNGQGILLVSTQNSWIENCIFENARLYYSDNNTLSNNTCEDSRYGIYLSYSNNNLIYHNNFVNNATQARDFGTNYWNNDYPSGGNYWSDYAGVDNYRGENQDIPGNDGIGDTPYYIPGDNNRDRYPLMNPWPLILRDVEVSISPPYQSGPPGTTLVYTVTLKNKGNVSDNYDLTADDNTNWSLTLPETLTDVIPGESRTVNLGVGIPDSAENCTRDNVIVTVISWADNTVEDSASCIAHAIVPEVQRWDALLTTTFSQGSDDAIFGVRPDATADFDSAYDLPEPPPPVEPPYVQAYFHYPRNAPLPTRMHLSCIPPEDIMEWPLRVSYHNGADNITLSWSLENVPTDYAVLLFKGEDLVADMMAVDNYTFQTASSDFDLTILVIVDTTPPTSSVNAISPYWQTSSSFVITATASDALSGVARVALWYRYSSDNFAWGVWTWFENDNVPPWSWTFTSPNGNGYYQFYSMARDVVGNEEAAPVTADSICGVDNEAPTKPSGLTPSGGAWLKDNAPLLSWAAASDTLSGVDYYEIQVDDNNDFSSPENTGTTTSAYYAVGNELKEGAQYWRVRAVDKASNVGAWENDWFRIDVTPPGKPVLASPENKAVMNIASITFTWTEPEAGVTYHIQIDNEASFTSSYVHENTVVTDNSYSYTLSTDGTYYWRVSAIDAANNEGPFADNYNFTIVARGVDVFISPSYQSGLPGTTLSYTVTVTNTGSVADNYALTASDDAGWVDNLTLSENLLEVPPGESKTTTLTMTVPENAVPCTEDNVTVTATSQIDNAVSDSASCIAHAKFEPVCGVDVTVEPKHQRGTPGTRLTFPVTVHNTGNIEDNYHLWVENNGWPVENIWLENEQLENIKPGESKVTKLHVHIPENAEPCTHKEIVVVAESEFCGATENDNALIQVVSAYLHAEEPIVLEDPVSTQWHELYPNFSKRYHLTSWEDTNGDGKLGPSDQIDMTDNETGELDNYHVKDVTVTLLISKKPDRIENMYVELEEDFENWDNLKKDPVSTQWHEIWPVFSKRYHLVSWEDENWDGALGPSDQIGMMDKENGETYWYHVDEVAIDIILCKKLAVGPSAPILKSPADGTITNDNKPTFEWTVGSNADNHQLLVDDDPGFTSPIENRLFGSTDNTYTSALENSLPDDNYSWKVIATSALGENQSSVWTFVIDTVSPAAPSLISPANGTITDDNTPTFDWSDVTGAENYDLLVDDDANFSSPEIQVTVSASTYKPTAGLPDGSYSWKVRARDAAGNVGDWSSTWTLIISVARGVDVYISPSYQSGLPGATLSYSVTVKNEGNISDTFNLTATDSAGWGPTLSRYSLALGPKAYDTVALAVTIPTDASVGDQDNITITAESTKDPTVSDSAKCTAQATALRRRVEASISPDTKSGPPGETLTYTVTIVNEGDAEDTYDLTATDALAWGASVSPTSLTIAAGSSGTTTMSVVIPDGTASGTDDEITVTATSRADLTVSDSATCIASAAAVMGVKVSISPETKSGPSEEMLTYTVTVKNEGNVGDTYILSTAGAPDWSPRVENTSLTLNAGEVGETTLTVTIPPGASEGASKTVTVTAISVGDPTVVGSVTCKATVKGVPEGPEVLPIPLAISAFLIGAAILASAYLLRARSKRAARRRVLRGPRRF